ncbi:MAG TPA: hypothetical protein VLG44_03700 [Chlamydiales bacterium]|nr:hypothetical protein [Chlamydiales bacterium]
MDSEISKKEAKPKKKKAPLPLDSSFDEFMKKFTEAKSAEDKLHLAILYMRSSLSQEGSPHFKEFWEARKVCLPLFKEVMNSALKGQLWGQFLELSNEALRLKELLYEQSSFAVEQIDLAMQAFEEELKHFDRLLSEAPEIAWPEIHETLQDKIPSYNSIQRELGLLGTLASRVHSLRKEVMKTEMRLRDKSRLLKRLSEAGDKIFPRRKELMQKVSEEFAKDVDAFIQKHFTEEKLKAPLYALREEIKALQSIAKVITLTPEIFTQTRLRLSECWDKVKVLEKERKKEIAEKKEEQEKNRLELVKKIAEFREKANDLSFEQKRREIDELYKTMQRLPLQRSDLPELRKELDGLKSTYLVREKPKKEAPVQKPALTPAVDHYSPLKQKLEDLSQKANSLTPVELQSEVINLKVEIEKASISKEQSDNLRFGLDDLMDLLFQKKVESAGSDSEKIEEILEERRKIRQEMKARLDAFRKVAGGSGFDFEKAMLYREFVDKAKDRLLKIDEEISLLEEQLGS